jgi:hypothetical protein
MLLLTRFLLHPVILNLLQTFILARISWFPYFLSLSNPRKKPY